MSRRFHRTPPSSGHPLFRPKVAPVAFEWSLFAFGVIGAIVTIGCIAILLTAGRADEDLFWVIIALGFGFALGSIVFGLRFRSRRLDARRLIEDLRHSIGGRTHASATFYGRTRRSPQSSLGPSLALAAAALMALGGLSFFYLQLWENQRGLL